VTGHPTTTATGAGADLNLLVRSTVWEAEGVLSVWLEHPDGAPLPTWSPGAHIEVTVGAGLKRQYSLCGDPSDRARWRIAVLREPKSRGGSEWIHSRLRPGDRLPARGPKNHFELVDAEDYRLVAGGIAITPLLPMVRAIADRQRPWKLHYLGRRRCTMAFVRELEAYPEHVTIRPTDELGVVDVQSFVATAGPNTAVYCCGPDGLIRAVEVACKTLPPGALHVERFAAATPGEARGAQDRSFEVVLQRSRLTLRVAPDQSILDAIEAAGVQVPCSCCEGFCGTCETKVLEGEPDHRDSLLTPEERAKGGTMMVCVSRARSARLVLDL